MSEVDLSNRYFLELDLNQPLYYSCNNLAQGRIRRNNNTAEEKIFQSKLQLYYLGLIVLYTCSRRDYQKYRKLLQQSYLSI